MDTIDVGVGSICVKRVVLAVGCTKSQIYARRKGDHFFKAIENGSACGIAGGVCCVAEYCPALAEGVGV